MANRINKIMNQIQSVMSNIYKNTYSTQDTRAKATNLTLLNLSKNIDDIAMKNQRNTGSSNLSVLYSKINSKNRDIFKEVESILNDSSGMESVMSLYSQNTYLKEQDEQIDIICKLMPQLQAALDLLKENVIACEQLSKDFLYMNALNLDNIEHFSNNCKALKKKYNLQSLIEEIYDNTSKYGEEFVYVLPYKNAMADVMSRGNLGKSDIVIKENTVISDSGEKFVIDNNTKKALSEYGFSFSIEHDMLINESKTALKKIFNVKHNQVLEDDGLRVDDGVMDYKKDVSDEKEKLRNQLKIPGAIVKRLERHKVIPLYIENICLGYYYIECSDETFNSFNTRDRGNILNSFSSSTSEYKKAQEDIAKDNLFKNLSKVVADIVDVNFINANPNITKEIYLMLKYYVDNNAGTKFKITFIPPENMHHFYFKMDPKTHHGISDLANSLIPAKLFCGMYVSNVIAVMSRGNDKRAYYVRQNVDTNISQLMMNTINQIKRGNFNMRQINNINRFINTVGKYNDMVIPVGPSGDSPINFEVIQGQDIPVKTELMDRLEEMAVSATNIPLEAVQQRMQQIDFATQLTMVNIKVLKLSYKRQGQFQLLGSPFITDLYNYEFGTNDEIELLLPTPIYSNMQQNDIMLENNITFADKLATWLYGDNTATEPGEIDMFKRLVVTDRMAGIVDIDKLQKFSKLAALRYQAEKRIEAQ